MQPATILHLPEGGFLHDSSLLC